MQQSILLQKNALRRDMAEAAETPKAYMTLSVADFNKENWKFEKMHDAIMGPFDADSESTLG